MYMDASRYFTGCDFLMDTNVINKIVLSTIPRVSMTPAIAVPIENVLPWFLMHRRVIDRTHLTPTGHRCSAGHNLRDELYIGGSQTR